MDDEGCEGMSERRQEDQKVTPAPPVFNDPVHLAVPYDTPNRPDRYGQVDGEGKPDTEGHRVTIRQQLQAMLIGIDTCSTEHDEAWWETSTGADFGHKKLEQLIAFCESLVPQWTTKKPTERGFYWYRPTEWAEPRIVIIENGLMHQPRYGITRVCDTDGQWAGPLEPPQ